MQLATSNFSDGVRVVLDLLWLDDTSCEKAPVEALKIKVSQNANSDFTLVGISVYLVCSYQFTPTVEQ